MDAFRSLSSLEALLARYRAELSICLLGLGEEFDIAMLWP